MPRLRVQKHVRLLSVATLMVILAAPAGPAVARASTLAPGSGPIVAVAIRGDIYTIPVSGGAPRRLTAYGLNSNPVISPDGRLIAYLSASRRYMTNGNPTTHGVWFVPIDGRADGSSAYKLTVTDPAVDRGNLSWSPDGRHLAYYEGATVVVSDVNTRRRRVVLHIGSAFSRILGVGNNIIAWSPDGRQIAMALPENPGASYPRDLRVAIANLSTDHVSTVRVRFPHGTLGRPIPPGSYPSGDGLAWTSDGRRLVIETLAEGEGPPRLTGLWHVGSMGGMAQLFVGTPRGVRQAAYPSGTPLDNASHVVVSPDRTRMLTDRDNRFWLSTPDGTRGRFLNTRLPPACTLTQYVWTADSSAVAYVAACRQGTSLSLANPRPHQLFAVLDNAPGRLDLDLAPAYRNVGGGY